MAAFAQLPDTTYLQELKVYGIPFSSHATGSTIEKIAADSSVESLADRLFSNTTLCLKTYGNGQLTTISMRGTTASQTAVLWNGININSPTLGQTDFSLLPLFLIDEVSVRYGSSSALYGSDAIGGSILLGQSPAQFKKKFQGSVFQQIGSFGKTSSGLKITTGNEHLESRTKVFYSYLNNDFRFNSPAVGYSKIQHNASVENYGLDQQLFYKINSRQQISAEGMLTHNFRKIQPPVTNNDANETLLDDHVRISLSYINTGRAGIISATAAYINSDQHYSSVATNSRVQSTQLSTVVTVDKSLNAKSNIRYGTTFNYFTARSKNYTDHLTDYRYDFFTSFRHALSSLTIVSLDLRQGFYNKKYTPFTPSIGMESIIKNKTLNKITWRAQIGRGFRVPTLNDRYWQPGGNPDLLAENSYNIESGVRWNFQSQLNGFIDIALFRNWMNDMIMWLPGNVWSPVNLQKVNVHGLEARTEFTQQINNLSIQLKTNYSFVKSLNQKGLNSADKSSIDKQLPYVPVHTLQSNLNCSINNWTYSTRVMWVSERFTTSDNTTSQSLEPYALLSCDLSKKILIQDLHVLLKAECNNILNTYYETMQNHAMPGRNYTLSLFINFKK